MTITDGVTVVLDGGSFTGGVTGGSVELKNGAVFIGSALNTDISFGETFTFPATGSMSVTGGSIEFGTLTISSGGSVVIASSNVTGTTSLVNNGTFTISGDSIVDIEDIDGYSDTTSIECLKASGTTWRVASLLISGTETSYVDEVLNAHSITLESPLVVEQLGVFLGAAITLSDTFLTIKSGVYVSSYNDNSQVFVNGTGFLAVEDPSSFDSGFVLESGIKLCGYGAGITAMTLVNGDGSTATLGVTRTNTNVPYLVEKRLGTASSYTTVDAECDEDSLEIETTPGRPNVVRIFDGENFFTDVSYVLDVASSSSSQSGRYVYELECYGPGGSSTLFRNEAATFLGSVGNKDTGGLVKRSEASSVSVTVYKYDSYNYGSGGTTVVPAWTSVSIDKRCFLESSLTLDLWGGSGGCNFLWIPNQNVNTFVADRGKYVVSFNVVLLSGSVETFSTTIEVV